VNDLFVSLGLESWKPLLRPLVMPPVPLLLMLLFGAALLARRRSVLGWGLVLSAVVALWASSTTLVGQWLVDGLTRPPPALSARAVAGLARAPKTALVVLGAGRRLLAPEYGAADLPPLAIERLRYGAWLARQTALPMAFSGGVALGNDPGPTEADIARHVAERDFGLKLRWTEDRSRDTNENAIRSVALLRGEGIERIVLVTHGFHMRRASAAFRRAIAHQRATIELVLAPMGLHASQGPTTIGDWLPTMEGFALTRLALHEWLGWLAGA